jgi:hypothetical protein
MAASLLPNAQKAFVQREKLAEYLLDLTHKDGGPKAAFLLGFGFELADWKALRIALLEHARTRDVVRKRVTIFGDIFEVVGELSTPDGRNPTIKSVWMIDHGSDAPRLITLIPS